MIYKAFVSYKRDNAPAADACTVSKEFLSEARAKLFVDNMLYFATKDFSVVDIGIYEKHKPTASLVED